MKSARHALAALASLVAPALLAFAALAPAPAAAETLTCTNITSLPTTISVPGHYCLNQNFSAAYASPAIVVSANNVVLDCNDHYINNTSGSVTGVHATNRSQVTVRNCVIINFGRGIAFFETIANNSKNNLVTGNRVLRSRLTGIQMAGSANVVEFNRVSDNFGGSALATYGILVSAETSAPGVANVVRNNTITAFAPSRYVDEVGIYLIDVDNTAVLNNTISGLFPPLDKTAQGIVAAPGVLNNAAVGNTVLAITGNPPGGGGGITYGGGSTNGISFEADPDTQNRNACRFNVVGHWQVNVVAETTLVGCVKDGNTEF